MWMTPFSFCSTPVTLISRAPITTGRYCSNLRGQMMVLAMPVSSSSVMKMALPVARPLTHQHDPADGDAPARLDGGKQLVAHDAARIEIAAQERHRMRLQRQMQMAIILDHLLARQHRRQMRVGLHLRHRSAREQRQIVLVAGPLKRLHGPERIAAA